MQTLIRYTCNRSHPRPPPPLQVVYVYGGENEFCAVEGINGQHVRYLPEEAIGVAQWFGVTAFLFCVHSMVCTYIHVHAVTTVALTNSASLHCIASSPGHSHAFNVVHFILYMYVYVCAYMCIV